MPPPPPSSRKPAPRKRGSSFVRKQSKPLVRERSQADQVKEAPPKKKNPAKEKAEADSPAPSPSTSNPPAGEAGRSNSVPQADLVQVLTPLGVWLAQGLITPPEHTHLTQTLVSRVQDPDSVQAGTSPSLAPPTHVEPPPPSNPPPPLDTLPTDPPPPIVTPTPASPVAAPPAQSPLKGPELQPPATSSSVTSLLSLSSSVPESPSKPDEQPDEATTTVKVPTPPPQKESTPTSRPSSASKLQTNSPPLSRPTTSPRLTLDPASLAEEGEASGAESELAEPEAIVVTSPTSRKQVKRHGGMRPVSPMGGDAPRPRSPSADAYSTPARPPSRSQSQASRNSSRENSPSPLPAIQPPRKVVRRRRKESVCVSPGNSPPTSREGSPVEAVRAARRESRVTKMLVLETSPSEAEKSPVAEPPEKSPRKGTVVELPPTPRKGTAVARAPSSPRKGTAVARPPSPNPNRKGTAVARPPSPNPNRKGTAVAKPPSPRKSTAITLPKASPRGAVDPSAVEASSPILTRPKTQGGPTTTLDLISKPDFRAALFNRPGTSGGTWAACNNKRKLIEEEVSQKLEGSIEHVSRANEIAKELQKECQFSSRIHKDRSTGEVQVEVSVKNEFGEATWDWKKFVKRLTMMEKMWDGYKTTGGRKSSLGLPPGAGMLGGAEEVEDPFFDTDVQVIGEATLSLQSLSNMLEHSSDIRVLSKPGARVGSLSVCLHPCNDKGLQGPWEDEDDDPFVEEPEELLDKSIKFNVEVQKLQFEESMAVGRGQCKFSNVQVEYKIRPGNPAERSQTTAVVPTSTMSPHFGHFSKHEFRVDGEDDLGHLVNGHMVFTAKGVPTLVRKESFRRKSLAPIAMDKLLEAS